MPDPAQDRLASRHEYVLHFAVNGCYYDLFGYAEKCGTSGANPGDVWQIAQERNTGKHLAPFPRAIADRDMILGCPGYVCPACNRPRRRMVRRTTGLDATRPQAMRATELMREKRLSPEHIAAVQATGISDAGKARLAQNGTARNTESVRVPAREAKAVLGGYFTEFGFAKRVSDGWPDCGCDHPFRQGVVLDPFMGSGTTLEVALGMGRSAIGVDLDATLSEAAPQCRM